MYTHCIILILTLYKNLNKLNKMLSNIIKRNLHNLNICKSFMEKPTSNIFVIDLNYDVVKIDTQYDFNSLQEKPSNQIYEKNFIVKKKNKKIKNLNEYEMFSALI